MIGKKSVVLLTILALVVGMLGACSQSAGKAGGSKEGKVKIRIAHDSNVQHPAHQALLEFEKAVEAKSNGKIDVQLYPAAQMGNVSEMMEQTRRGDIEMSFGASTLFSQSIPEFSVLDSFYLFDDVSHAHRVLDGKGGQELMKVLETKGLKGLGYMEIGFRNFSNSKRPITKVEDVKGLKIRGYSPLQIKAWESLGVSLTNLAWPEVFTSLQQNLIDGQESATTSFYEAKFFEAQKYWSLTQHIYTDYLWYANKKFMDGLAPEDRKIIEGEAKKAIQLERTLIEKQEKDTLDKLSEAGIKINEVPLEERRKMGEIMNTAIKKDIINQAGQDLYDKFTAEVETQRK
ncbi:TRAP transporter substrate-binding protein [Bacillus sp. S3]|uniref:TRAP transporter substrate-binding protein n=1 Tax=Bacillus sp. S3 TaxID=486398 RepID=UPI00118AEC75|nr:TRAP transporter substrate-binding protein [Bacillus sp. S3]QCJ44732.1 TRAP transporter substrate-binding protein [Bacillus sp. S3]